MAKEMKTGTFTYNNESYDFDFRTSLSAYEKQMFVNTVINNIIDDDGYHSIIRDLIFDFVIVELFTNVDTSFINMKDDNGSDVSPIIVAEHFLKESNVVDIVKANIEDELLYELNHAVDLNIQYLTGIHPNPINESLASLLYTIEKKVGEIDLDVVMNMAQKFAGMTEDFTLENLVKEYMNSDTHKENLAAIEDAKKE